MNTDLSSYRPGSWFGIFGENATVLLPPSEKRRVAALWELVDDGADFDEVLDALIASGLRDLPGFVLVSDLDGQTKVVLRGPAVATFNGADGETVVDGSTASTWVEQSLGDVTTMRIELEGDDPAAEQPTFVISGGLVRVAQVTSPAAEGDSADPASDELSTGGVSTGGLSTGGAVAGGALAGAAAGGLLASGSSDDSGDADSAPDDSAFSDPVAEAGDAGLDEASADEASADETGAGDAGFDEAGADGASADETGADEAGFDEAGADGASADETGADETGADDAGFDTDQASTDQASTYEASAEAVGTDGPQPDADQADSAGLDSLFVDTVADEEAQGSPFGAADDPAWDRPAGEFVGEGVTNVVSADFGSPHSLEKPGANPQDAVDPTDFPATQAWSPESQSSWQAPGSEQWQVPGPEAVDGAFPPAPFDPNLVDPNAVDPNAVDPNAGWGSQQFESPSYEAPGAPGWGTPEAPAGWDQPAVGDHDGNTQSGGESGTEAPAFGGYADDGVGMTSRPVARLLLSHGEQVDVDRAILLGRAPEARRFSSTDQPRLVTVPSPNQEISSTHLEVRPGSGVDHGSAVVTDMGSTNGTVLVQPGMAPEDLQPGIPVQLIPGAIIDLGDGLTIQVTNP